MNFQMDAQMVILLEVLKAPMKKQPMVSQKKLLLGFQLDYKTKERKMVN